MLHYVSWDPYFSVCDKLQIIWNHSYHGYLVFSSRIHICFWVLYALIIKLVAWKVMCSRWIIWVFAPAICGPRHVVLYFLNLARIITADFLWIRTTRTDKQIFFSYPEVEGGSVAMTTKYGLKGNIRKFVSYPSLIFIHFLISLGDF